MAAGVPVRLASRFEGSLPEINGRALLDIDLTRGKRADVGPARKERKRERERKREEKEKKDA